MDWVAQLALDTGATRTLISEAVLLTMGYQPGDSDDHAEILTASGIENSPIVELRSIEALEVRRTHWPVLAHPLPSDAGIHGLLGLDFLRGMRLSLDFQKGLVQLFT
jgi:predicted aspartyl protease